MKNDMLKEVTVQDSERQFDNLNLVQYVAELRQEFDIKRRMLFLQAPQFLFESINLDVIKNRGYYAYPPTGLQWIANSLEGRNIDIDIFDLNFHFLYRVINDAGFDHHDWLRILDEYLERYNPSIIGVTCLSVYTDLFNTHHPLTEIFKHLIQKNRYIIIAGGPTVTNEINRYLSRGMCHFIIRGEGEDRTNYLLDILFDEEETHIPVQGIYFNFHEKIEQTEGITKVVELNGNVIKTYKNIDVESYNGVGSLNPYSRMAGQDNIYSVFQLNRGCRSNCKFCGVRSFMGRGIRTCSVKDLLKEIHYLVEERNVRHFEVLDDDFLANKEAVITLLRGLCRLRQKFGITWSANNGLLAASITNELLALMRDSGCIGFKIGIESGNAEMLRIMRKPGNLNIFKNVAGMIQNYPELFVGGNYIIGLYGEETFGQMLETFTFSCLLNFDWSSFTLFQFTSRPNAIEENLKTDGIGATDFIPAKDTANRDIQNDRLFPLGPEVFNIPKDIVPERKQMKNIWLTFNLAGNYINNKNLKPGGNPHQFVSWVEAVQVSYPDNPYMHLFSGLGHILLGNTKNAKTHYEQCKKIVGSSESWDYRFKKFGFDGLMAEFPSQDSEVFEKLDAIQSPYKEYIT